jgi:hypothetical protein
VAPEHCALSARLLIRARERECDTSRLRCRAQPFLACAGILRRRIIYQCARGKGGRTTCVSAGVVVFGSQFASGSGPLLIKNSSQFDVHEHMRQNEFKTLVKCHLQLPLSPFHPHELRLFLIEYADELFKMNPH